MLPGGETTRRQSHTSRYAVASGTAMRNRGDGGSVQLKAVSGVDPADLSGEEARRVAYRLLELADEADEA